MNIPFISVKGNPAVRMLNFHHVSCAPQDLLDVVVDNTVGGYTNLYVNPVQVRPKFE